VKYSDSVLLSDRKMIHKEWLYEVVGINDVRKNGHTGRGS